MKLSRLYVINITSFLNSCWSLYAKTDHIKLLILHNIVIEHGFEFVC